MALAAERLGEAAISWRRDEPLRRHTSMRVGGPADRFAEVEDEAELAAVLRCAEREGAPVFVLGGGTNLIVSDAGVRGVTVKLGRSFTRTGWVEAGDEVVVTAGAAANLKRLVLESMERALAGIEFAEGIPGTVGGGLLMNAGAFGGELSNVLTEVRGVTRWGEVTRLAAGSLRFGYRWLELPRGFIATAVSLRLRPGVAEDIEARAAEARRKRTRHQPLGLPNAGSIFKNPPGDHAGRLIELVGMKGARVGDAQVSPRHANFIVNLGSARAAEVRELMWKVRDEVWRQRGVWLLPEVRLIGDW